jgi:hypothetical protein
MKKTTVIYFLVFIISSIALKAQNGMTRTYLCDKKWQMSSWTVSPAYEYFSGKGKQTDLYKDDRACLKDDYYVFTFKQTFTRYNYKVKCMETEGDVVNEGNWSFVKGNKNLFEVKVTKGSSGSFQKLITELSTDKLVWTYKKVEDGITYTFTETYTAIDATIQKSETKPVFKKRVIPNL